MKELDILCGFNMNTYQNIKFIVCDGKTISSKFLSSNIKNYHQFCKIYGLKQLIKLLTCATCRASTLIDHILASFFSRVCEKVVIDVGMSDYQLIFCTWKILYLKASGIHKYLYFWLFKNYTVNNCKEACN